MALGPAAVARSPLVVLAALLLTLGLGTAVTRPAAAQGEGVAADGVALDAVVVTCDPALADPTAPPFSFSGCSPLAGVTVAFETADGSFSETCSASCSVVVPYGSTVAVSIDATAVAAGLRLVSEPSQTFEIRAAGVIQAGLDPFPLFVFEATEPTDAEATGPVDYGAVQLDVEAITCPDGFKAPEADPITALEAACSVPQAGIDISVRPISSTDEYQPRTASTGSAGLASVPLSANAAGYNVNLTVSGERTLLPEGALGYIAACEQADGDDAGVVHTVAGFHTRAAAEDGDLVECRVFYVYGPDGAAPTGPGAGPVVSLPNTGAGDAHSAESGPLVLLALAGALGLAAVAARRQSA